MAIKTQVQQGGYRVDSQLVAEAILLRMLRRAAAEARACEAQSECSNPSSVPAASTNTASV
ncbi:MAG: flagellar biosynthesis anti-sigma factor FlgM [Solirubrobacteraceae bacterium]